MFNQNFGQRQSFLESLKMFFKSKSPLSKFILINIGVFLTSIIIGLLAGVYSFLFQLDGPNSSDFPQIIDALMLPSSIPQFIEKPWSIFTYQFLHVSFWHIFFNMIMLYFSGKIFLSFLKNKQFVWVYILGGIAGGAFYVAAFNFFPVFESIVSSSRALGASASVLAVLTCVAVYIPNYNLPLFLIGNVKIKWVAIAIILIDIISIDKGNPGGHIAHIGGAFWGLIAGIFYSKSFLKNIKFYLKTKFKKKPFKVKYPNSSSANNKVKTDYEYNELRAEKQKKMDAILDKISKFGYDKLTKEEKEFLFKSSNRN